MDIDIKNELCDKAIDILDTKTYCPLTRFIQYLEDNFVLERTTQKGQK